MRVTITFNTGNAAFEYNGMEFEIENLLDQAKSKIFVQMCRSSDCVCDALESSDRLFDSNGNTVGSVKVG